MKNIMTVFIESNWYSLNIEDFDDFENDIKWNRSNTYISFQVSDLIREFNKTQLRLLPKIIDLISFDKQMSQEGKEFRDFSNWTALGFLRHHQALEDDFELHIKNVKRLLEQLATLYKKILEKDKVETRRFNQVEQKINKLIYRRQRDGIKVSSFKAKSRCKEIEREIYYIKNELQLNHNILTPNNTEFQKDYLKQNGFKRIKTLLYTFKIHRKENKICNLLYELLRNQQDLDSLLYILSHWGGDERTYPSYLGFGTITSRITLSYPSLQNLRKSNRDIIVADEQMELLYVDYSQFEAGILAWLSEDEKLIELYDSDIYKDLAYHVLNNEEERSEAKVIFYRFMYGDETLPTKAKIYFKKFNKLIEFKKQIENELKLNNKVSSIFGNSRFSFNEEECWALSHVIQSTASYIYKEALINVEEKVGGAKFLIPMHDGTVYQIKKSDSERIKRKIEQLYLNAFMEVFPDSKPKLTMKDKF